MFKVYTVTFEGKSPSCLLPWSFYGSVSSHQSNHRALKRYLENGGKIFIKIEKGARAGTIGQLVITPEDLDTYEQIKTGYGETLRTNKQEWLIKFDDRDTMIKVGMKGNGRDFNWPGVLITDYDGPTVYAFNKAEPKAKPPGKVLYDHFGVQLEPGQLVLYPEGRQGTVHNRFGYIESISPAGTIKVESIKTRKGHAKAVSSLSPTVNASDIVVLDSNDIKDKVILAKLTHA